MKKQTMSFAAGLLTGVILMGGGAAYAAGITAHHSPQTVDLDGRGVQLEAYNIDGYNYVKLRDVGQAVNFNVYWADNMVHIDSDAPYTGEAPRKPEAVPPTSAPNYSTQANPAIFTGDLTHEAYNTVRDTVVHRDEIAAGAYTPAMIALSTNLREQLQIITSKLGNYPSYDVIIPEYGKLAVTAKCTSAYDAAVSHTQGFIYSLSGISQREQVKEIIWYVADRLTYSTAITSPTRVLASDAVSSGNCMSYAHSFQFLCNRAGIPCILVSSNTHQWNMVYVDSQWWCVDVSANDAGDDVSNRDAWNILSSTFDNYGSDFIDQDPSATRFAQELLVPGSTK